jgi:alkylation response protein AidB-like acyl-CoA dehydrogenase
MPGLLIGEEYGGAGLGLLEAAIVAEELGRSMAPVPFVGTAVMAPLALALAGSDAQKKHWLPEIAADKTLIGLAVAETASGARRGAGVTTRNGLLNGKASFALDATDASAFILADEKQKLYLLDSHAKGVRTKSYPTIDGTRPATEIVLTDAEAEPLGKSTPEILGQVINAGRIAMAAESLGAAEEMLRQAVAYAKERKQFDRTIGSFQAVKHMCAEMAAELQPCQSLIWYAAYAFDKLPDEAMLSGSLAKSHMDEIGRFVARTATEVHGGMGYTDLMGLHFWFKRIGFNRAQLGSPEKLRADAALLQGM